MTGHDEILGYHLEQAYRYRVELGRVDDDGTRARQARRRLPRRGRARARSIAAKQPRRASLLDRACRLLDA